MSLLSYFFKTDLFKAFDEKLKRFQAIDEELTKITEEIEEKALVDAGTFFHQKRVFDMNKIDKGKMNELLVLFRSMESMEYNLLRDFQKNKTKFLKESKEITEYIEREFATIFQHLKDAKTILTEIIEYLQEFKAEELKNDFEKLDEKLHEIQKFISIIHEQMECLEKKSKEKKFLAVKHEKYDPIFLKKCERYGSLKTTIEDTMREILEAKTYVPQYHEEIKYTERYKGCRHARITENIRLFYYFDKDTKTIRWVDIITKNEFDKTK